MKKNEEKTTDETTEEATDEEEAKPVYDRAYTCPRCGYDNPPRAGFCFVCGEPLITEMKNIPGYALEWTHEMDEHLRKRFQKASLEDLKRDLDRRFGLSIPEMMILRRAEALGLVGKELKQMKERQKPEYLKSNIVWMQGAETARVRGDVSIPENDTVPFNMIVEGNLIAHSGVVFQGGLHVKGNTVLGDRNSVMKSLICEEMAVLGRHTVVENIVDSDGPVFVRRGVIVGTGEKGGIASGNTVYVELGFAGKTKIYASKGVKVVKNIHDILPEDLKKIIGKEREHVTPIPPVIAVSHPEVRRGEVVSPEREIEAPTPYSEVQAPKAAEEEEAEIPKIELPKHDFAVREHMPMDETDAIFRSFEERIRDFGKAKERKIETVGLKELREHAEVEVYKLAAAGHDVNDIGLRLFMDPFEVQGTLNTLIAKGYLDENLKPKKRETRQDAEVFAPETTQEAENQRPPHTETEQADSAVEAPEDEQETLDEKEISAAEPEEEKNGADDSRSSDNDQSNAEDVVKELKEL